MSSDAEDLGLGVRQGAAGEAVGSVMGGAGVAEVETFTEAGPEAVDEAVSQAVAFAPTLAGTSPAQRALLLRRIAGELEARRPDLVSRADRETSLGAVRLEGELSRAVVQFEAFADFVEAGGHLGVRIDHADPMGRLGPRPDLRKLLVPLGPVVVFGASNFPFAFSTPGGDTASALAAGCPVVVKGHPSHPGTSEIAAEAIIAALRAAGLPPGGFALLQGTDPALSRQLVAHPQVKAVGFTGSRAVGRTLWDVGVARAEPILVHAEMGSINPVFVTSRAVRARAEAIGEALALAVTAGAGQFCTKPGVVVLPAGSDSGSDVDAFVAGLAARVAATRVVPLLNPRIAAAYQEGLDQVCAMPGVQVAAIGGQDPGPVSGRTAVVEASWDVARAAPGLLEEHFGPMVVVLRAPESDFPLVAAELEGQLTATVHAQAADHELAGRLLDVLVGRAGRVVYDGVPTGVAVTAAMNHGGPYPAATTATTSVGTDAALRFLRPVAYQGVPDELLPEALREANPWGVQRIVDGAWQPARPTTRPR